MRQSESVGKLAEALSKAQGAFKHVDKDGKSHHGKYATLAAVLEVIREPLATNGLAYIQAPSVENGNVTVTTRLMFADEWLETDISAPAQSNIQQLGSSISYLRRYSLMSLLSLAADDDDDGNAAVKAAPAQQRAPQRQQAPPAPQKARPAEQAPEQNDVMEQWTTKLGTVGVKIRTAYPAAKPELDAIFAARKWRESVDAAKETYAELTALGKRLHAEAQQQPAESEAPAEGEVIPDFDPHEGRAQQQPPF